MRLSSLHVADMRAQMGLVKSPIMSDVYLHLVRNGRSAGRSAGSESSACYINSNVSEILALK